MEHRQQTQARRTAVMLLVSLSMALVLALTLHGPSAGAASGPFRGSYSGTGILTISGSGSATFLGASTITSNFHCISSECLGTATLTSSAHPTDSLRLGIFCLKPCPNPMHWRYGVSSGTGTFGKATGGGTAIYTFAVSGPRTYTFTATFSGTLTF